MIAMNGLTTNQTKFNPLPHSSSSNDTSVLPMVCDQENDDKCDDNDDFGSFT